MPATKQISWSEKLQALLKNGLQKGVNYLRWGVIGSGIAGVGLGYAALSSWGGALVSIATTVGVVAGGGITIAGIATVAAVGAAVAFGLGFVSGMLDDTPLKELAQQKRQDEAHAHMEKMREKQLAMQNMQMDKQIAMQNQKLGLSNSGFSPQPGLPQQPQPPGAGQGRTGG